MIENAIRDFLLANAGLTTVLTGGIVTFDDTKRNGISLIDTPALFLSGFLRPCAMVKQRSESAMNAMRDSAEKQTAGRGIVEIYFYDDGDSGYTAISNASDLVYNLLTGVFVENAGWLRWSIDVGNIHDSSLDNAAVIRSEYMLTRIRGQ